MCAYAYDAYMSPVPNSQGISNKILHWQLKFIGLETSEYELHTQTALRHLCTLRAISLFFTLFQIIVSNWKPKLFEFIVGRVPNCVQSFPPVGLWTQNVIVFWVQCMAVAAKHQTLTQASRHANLHFSPFVYAQPKSCVKLNRTVKNNEHSLGILLEKMCLWIFITIVFAFNHLQNFTFVRWYVPYFLVASNYVASCFKFARLIGCTWLQ